MFCSIQLKTIRLLLYLSVIAGANCGVVPKDTYVVHTDKYDSSAIAAISDAVAVFISNFLNRMCKVRDVEEAGLYPSMRLDEYNPYQQQRRFLMKPGPQMAAPEVGPHELAGPDLYSMYDWQLGYVPVSPLTYSRRPVNYYVRRPLGNLVMHSMRSYKPLYTPLENQPQFEYTVPVTGQQNVPTHDHFMYPTLGPPTPLPTIMDIFTHSRPPTSFYSQELNVPYNIQTIEEGRKNLHASDEQTESSVGATASTAAATKLIPSDRDRKFTAMETIIREIRDKMDKETDIDDEDKANINSFLNDLEMKIKLEKGKPEDDSESNDDIDNEHKKTIIYIQNIIDDLEKKKLERTLHKESTKIFMEHTTFKSSTKQGTEEVASAEEENVGEESKSAENVSVDNGARRKNNDESESVPVESVQEEEGPPSEPTTTNASSEHTEAASSHETAATESLEEALQSDTHRKVNMEQDTEESMESEQSTDETTAAPQAQVTNHVDAQMREEQEHLVPDHTSTKTDLNDESFQDGLSRRVNENPTTKVLVPEQTTLPTTTAMPELKQQRRMNTEDSIESKQANKEIEETENSGQEVVDVQPTETQTTAADESTESFSGESLETTRHKASPFFDIFSNSSDIHLPAQKQQQLEKLRKMILYLYFHTKRTPKDHYKIGVIALKWFDTVSDSPTEQDKITFLKHWLQNNQFDDETYLYDKLIQLIKNPNKMNKEYGAMETTEAEGPVNSGATNELPHIEGDDLYRIGVIILKLQTVVNDDSDYMEIIRRIIKKPVAEYTERDKEIISQLLLLAKSPFKLERAFNKIRHEILNQMAQQQGGRKMNAESTSMEEEGGDGSKLIVAIMRVPPKAYRKNNAIATKQTREQIIRKLLDDLHKKMEANGTLSGETNDSSAESKEVTLKKFIIVDKDDGRDQKEAGESRRFTNAENSKDSEMDALIKSLMMNELEESDGRKSDKQEVKKIIIVDEKPNDNNQISDTVHSFLRRFNAESYTAPIEIATSTENVHDEVTQALTDFIRADEDNLMNTYRTYYDTVAEKYIPVHRDDIEMITGHSPFVRQLDNEQENRHPMDSEIERTTILNFAEDSGYTPYEYGVTFAPSTEPTIHAEQNTEEFQNLVADDEHNETSNDNKHPTNTEQEPIEENEFGKYTPYIKPLRRFLDIILHKNDIKEGPSKTYVENNQRTIINQNLGNATEGSENNTDGSGAHTNEKPEPLNGMTIHREIQQPGESPDPDMKGEESKPLLLSNLFQTIAKPIETIIGSKRRSLDPQTDATDSSINLTTTEEAPTEETTSGSNEDGEKINEFKTFLEDLKSFAKRRSSGFSGTLKKSFADQIKEIFEENQSESEEEKQHTSVMQKRNISTSTDTYSTLNEHEELNSLDESQNEEESAEPGMGRRSHNYEELQDDVSMSAITGTTDSGDNKNTHKGCKDDNITTEPTTTTNTRGSDFINQTSRQTEASTTMTVDKQFLKIKKSQGTDCNNNLKDNSDNPDDKSNEDDIDKKALERLKKTLQKAEQNLLNINQKNNFTLSDEDNHVENQGLNSELRKFLYTFRYLLNEQSKNNEMNKY